MPCRSFCACRRAIAPALVALVVCAIPAAAAASIELRYRVWTTENGLPQSTVRAIAQTPDGYLWFGTLDGLVRFDGVRMVVYTRSDAPEMTSNRVTTLFVDRHGTLWIGTEDGGILEKTGETFRGHGRANGVPGNEISKLTQDAEGNLWADTNNGYAILQGGRWAKTDDARARAAAWRVPADRPLPEAAAEGRRRQRWPLWAAGAAGRTWVLDAGLLYLRDNGKWLTISNPVPAVALPDPWCMFEDAEGTLWIGSDGALVQAIPTPVRAILPASFAADPPHNGNVYTLAEDAAGRVWVGTAGDPFVLDKGAPAHLKRRSWWPRAWVTSLELDDDGSLLAGSNSGLFRIRPGLGFEQLRGGPPVTDVERDRRGTLWVATFRGLYRQSESGWDRIQGLPSEDVKVLREARDGALWIGTYGGLARIEGDRIQKWTTADGLPGDRIRALHEDEAGSLWIGTYDTGLVRFRDGRFTAIRKRDGLFDDGVFVILDDGAARFYMCSNRGIHAVAKADLDAFVSGATRQITSHAWREADGMPSSECNGGRQPSGFRAADGTLWFPTQRGIAILDSNAAPDNPIPPPVVIEQVRVGPRTFTPDGPVVLDARERRLEVRYTANTFIRPDLARFRHRLEGFDDEWIEAGSVRVAQYSQIPPGRYVLTIAAANSDGVWNMKGRSLEVIVLPAVYETWWFRTGIGVGVAGLVVLLLGRRERALKRAHAAQQAFSRQLIATQETERTRFAAELHDGLGQRLVIIKNLALLTKIENGGTADARLGEIADQASHALGDVREIAKDLRPYQLDRLGLTRSLAALVRTAGDASQVTITSDMVPIDDAFPRGAAIHVYRAVQECLSNVLKHSRATEAHVTITRAADHIAIVVRDNGIGFPAAHGTPDVAGFGLTGIVERVTALGGRADIRSAPGEGTTIALTFDPKSPE